MTDVLSDAETLLKQLPEAVTRRAFGDRLSKAIHDLGDADHQVDRISALLRTANLTKYGSAQEQADALEDVIHLADKVGKSLEEAEDAETLREAVFEYSKDLKQAIATLDRSIRVHWQSIVRESFQPLIGLGELLASMNVANDLGGRLSACGRQATSVPNSCAASDLHTAISKLFADYAALQSERAAEIGEDEVGEFMNALAEKRATLSMVTPKVQDWLTRHHALDRLAIAPR
ncbi:hypothetical protein JF540_26335 [Salipiger thiooxidans]|uniref:hypothetical protein n=1 Tax=Salipiger thiooxidans TaxID=282683 RepID=UPI001A8F912C|nr:hypothetical protein [Salipiger thiooxidans]MBN8190197.1 hypothetical protein [Salipiger thiooxidans]